MQMYVGSVGLYAALKEQGFDLPRNCRDVNLVADLDQPLMLQYNVLLTPEDLQAVGRALESMGKDLVDVQNGDATGVRK